MSSKEVLEVVSEAEFYARVSFLAVQIAHEKAATLGSDEADTAYANRVLTGADDPLMLSVHVVAANSTIAKSLTTGAEVTDAALKQAIEDIWHTRALAFVPEPPPTPVASVGDENAVVPPRADHDNPPPPPPMDIGVQPLPTDIILTDYEKSQLEQHK